MNAVELKMVKEVLEILNDQFPSSKEIPSYKDYQKVKVEEAPYFTALYSKFGNFWYIHCINYNIWRNEQYLELIEDLKAVCEKSQIKLVHCYVFYAAIEGIKKEAKNGNIFLGKTLNQVTYVN